MRKACADVFMPVSCVCSPTVRQAELSPLFINLLKDQVREGKTGEWNINIVIVVFIVIDIVIINLFLFISIIFIVLTLSLASSSSLS